MTIRTRVLAIIFTKYNQEFCLSLWDPGGVQKNWATCLAVASLGSRIVLSATCYLDGFGARLVIYFLMHANSSV